ncbi:MAG: ATP-binding protein [Oligoflexia bacterium]|nr:ATP-binding protein [Oligoflexia bacterium]MBF0365487.1 ATP-binding protein [Oligoflexia bacterium]
MFIGRRKELEQLNQLKTKKMASLVCITGRRRIGKSCLIQEFSKKFKSFIEIQGLSPGETLSSKDQLIHFATKLSLRFNTRQEYFENWTMAFNQLAKLTQKGEHLIFLDEISWMAQKDPTFSSCLKEAWDTQIKKNPKVILVLCGSVSAWIEENILKNSSFEGRISLQMNLQEFSLNEINEFFNTNKTRLSSREKILILSATGGVAKYLEEVLAGTDPLKDLLFLCFNPNGFLFNEFEKIFTEVFERKSKTLEKVIRQLVEKNLSPSELAHTLKIDPNSDFSNYLHILTMAGLLSRDYYYHADGTQSKLSRLRLRDNYLRFYIKYIEPLRDKVINKAQTVKSVEDLKNISGLMGLQFENIILANRDLVHEHLKIDSASINSSSPHLQKKNSKNKHGCQVDLLIHTNMDVFYLCEMKCKKVITAEVIKEVEQKIVALSLPKRSVARPVLIYAGELSENHQEQLVEYFYKMISFEDLLE